MTTEQIYPMRLQKFLARAGVASRRGSEDLMTAGRVTVNGEVITELGSKVDPNVDVVCVDGAEVHLQDGCVYLMLHKPAGVLTTMSDPFDRPCVAELVPIKEYPGLFPVGRLDQDTTGLLLFTTDGELSQHLLHPKHHVDKTYEVVVEGNLRERDVTRLRKGGFKLPDGHLCAPAKITIKQTGQRSSEASITIHEGRKRQVKLMFGGIGHPVQKLHRSKFGPLELGNLKEGAWRMLTSEEVRQLKEAAGN